MAESLTLPLVYHGQELELVVRAFAYGDSHHVEVTVGGHPVVFEPDEEGNYRVLTLDQRIDWSLACEISQRLGELSD